MSPLYNHAMGIPRRVTLDRISLDVLEAMAGSVASECAVCRVPLVVWKVEESLEDLCGMCHVWTAAVAQGIQIKLTRRLKTVTLGEGESE